MSWSVSVTVEGERLEDVTLDLVQIRYGRRNARSSPSATTCTLGLVWKSVDALYDVNRLRLGARLVVEVEVDDVFPQTVTRFAGAITDVTVGRNTAQVIAATNILARLGRTTIDAPALTGTIPEAADTLWTAIETQHPDLGFDYTPAASTDVDLEIDIAPRAGTIALTALEDLLANDPAGFVYETISPPRLNISTGASRLAGQLVTPLLVPEAAVLDDIRLERSVASRANQVAVEWTGGTVTAEAGQSVRRYGPYGRNVSTDIANADDATSAAFRIAAAGGADGWAFDALTVELGRLEGFVSIPVFLALTTINRLVQLPPLPDGLPALPPLVYLEGFDETITRERWTLALYISDPRLIGWPQRWFEVPNSLRWVDLAGPAWDALDNRPWNQQPEWFIWEDYAPIWDDMLTEWIT